MNGHKIVNQNALHFITLTVVSWADVFSRKIYRDIIVDSLIYCQQEKGLVVNAYVVMSNHLHLVCYAKEPNLLSNVIRDFKKFTSKRIIQEIETNHSESRREWLLRLFKYHAKFNNNNQEYQFWYQHNKPIELESPTWINQKINYIHLNPVKNGLVDLPEAYKYSSASQYLGQKGLIEIEILDPGIEIGYING